MSQNFRSFWLKLFEKSTKNFQFLKSICNSSETFSFLITTTKTTILAYFVYCETQFARKDFHYSRSQNIFRHKCSHFCLNWLTIEAKKTQYFKSHKVFRETPKLELLWLMDQHLKGHGWRTSVEINFWGLRVCSKPDWPLYKWENFRSKLKIILFFFLSAQCLFVTEYLLNIDPQLYLCQKGRKWSKIAYSEVSIKRPALLNVLFQIFTESLY